MKKSIHEKEHKEITLGEQEIWTIIKERVEKALEHNSLWKAFVLIYMSGLQDGVSLTDKGLIESLKDKKKNKTSYSKLKVEDHAE